MPSVRLKTKKRQQPREWYKWANPEESYEIGVDTKVRKVGKRIGFVKSVDGNADGHCGLLQTIGASSYRGKRIRLSGYLKSEGVEDRCGFWLTVMDADRKRLADDEMRNRYLSGTLDWTACELVVDVPQEARFITFGAVLHGAGQLWCDGLKFESVGLDIPTTDNYAFGCQGRWDDSPANLDLNDLDENGWSKRWLKHPSPEKKYDIHIEKRAYQRLPAVFLCSNDNEKADNALVYQKFAAHHYRGKRFRLTAQAKAENVVGWAGLTATVSGLNNETFAYANMVETPIRGTCDWAKHHVVLDVHPRASVISIGMQLRGAGKIWVADFDFQEVDSSVPTTDLGTPPENLDFSEDDEVA